MEEEDDAELFLVIVPAILECLNEEKRPEHTSEYTGAKKVKEILEGHENWCNLSFVWRHEYLRRHVTILGVRVYCVTHEVLLLRSS